MNQPRVAILGSMEDKLRVFLESHPNGHERAAVVLFRRLHRPVDGLSDSDRFLAVDFYPFEEAWVTSSSPSHVAFDLRPLRELFRRCEEESLAFGFVHIHPGGYPDFSQTDEENELTLLKAICNRNGIDSHVVALLLTANTWKARVRHGRSPSESRAARHVIVVGQAIKVHLPASNSVDGDSALARQAAAFGSTFVNQLGSLRIAVVGAGGTGSPTATLLARSGVGELILIDNDKLERSNLNRVRGARTADVSQNKAMVLRNFIRSLGLPTNVSSIDALVDQNPTAIDALSSCDVLFGCTDDEIGREVLTTAAYIYLGAYIDVGLGGRVEEKNGRAYLRYHFGRVSTILPEWGECLFCQGVISEAGIRRQYAVRENPSMSAAEARDRYLEGGGEQAPGVGPFTSAVGDYGVATLYDLIAEFRKFPDELRRDLFTIDFVKMQLRSPAKRANKECVYCGTREYLLVKERYRLNRPMLGRPDASN
jgi:molybdopterin-synthase adenylyltransferase